MIDNKYVEGSSTPISKTDEHGNTYQTRELKDGSKHEILKNFPSVHHIQAQLHDTSSLHIKEFDYYWMAEYRTKKAAEQGNPAIIVRGIEP
jgi:demethylmenaquinone methyltransferase/2-methoxy-6-polyprenyl-1,4-benzoquinol methylase